jgi:serine/threonine protein phosphatase PrpC
LLGELIDQTKAKGAPDNITIVWASVSESDSDFSVSKFGAAK